MLRLPQRKAIRFIVQWLLALVFLAPGLAVFIISASKLSPASRSKGRLMEVSDPGIILLGEVSTMDINQNEISIRWAVGGWGDEYGYHANFDDFALWPHPGLPSLSRRVDFYIDGPKLAWSYNPAYVLGPDIYSAANHFTTTHPLNAFTDRTYATLFSAKHYVDIGVQVVDPETNLSLPIAGMKCDPQPGPALTGWTIGSYHWERGDENNETLAIAPVYTIEVTLNVHTWKLFYEVLMGFMILFGSVVTLISTAHLIRTSWAGNRKVQVAEMLAIPFALGSIIAALRTAFPPRSDLEIFLNEAIYYPCFVLAVWCVMAGVMATRSMAVRMLKDFRSWGEAMNPFEGMTRKKLSDLEKNFHTAKESEAEEELQLRMRSVSASSPIVGRTISGTGSMVWSPEGIEKTEEQGLLAKQETERKVKPASVKRYPWDGVWDFLCFDGQDGMDPEIAAASARALRARIAFRKPKKPAAEAYSPQRPWARREGMEPKPNAGEDSVTYAHDQIQARAVNLPLRPRFTTRRADIRSRSSRRIRELPPELLADILLKSMADGEIFGLKRHRELASVCRHWRDVVLSTPHFWNAITDNLRAGDPLANVITKLKRSRNTPLTIEYRGDQIDPELDVWDLVEPTTSRWEEATVTLHMESSAKVCSTLIKGLPNLERLTLLSEFFAEDVTLGPTPRLAELYLNQQVTLDTSAGTTLSALRRLVIKSVSPSSTFIINLLPTLAECPLLEFLHLDSISSIFDDTILFSPLGVSLPLLQILRIEAVTVALVATLLQHLRADVLKQLRVHSHSEGDDISVLRALARPRGGKGLILSVLNNRRTSSEICLSLGEEWIRIEDGTGRLFLDLGLDADVRNDMRNLEDLLPPVFQECAAATRKIALTVRLYHATSLEGLHILCEASPMVTSIHCYDRGQAGQMYRCVLRSGTGQITCQTCSSTEFEFSVAFPRLSELRLHVPHISSLLPTYNREVQLAYLSRQSIVAAASPWESPLEQNTGLKIYMNDTFMLPDPASLYQDPWSMPSFLQFDF
ncbi:hypothetical protein M407DRAFT_216230 [Tulasnella calospora MUT 4182]|uniref:Uncharacterized protein n=1 Tax=Tulasnella calospora MUT 4182 TaxID=1051891 RepID=A0A0C3QD22_9AGAM|nr:hypothetical protein M407DRAFT_216230 [Tulasnella calospora MUT 4182]